MKSIKMFDIIFVDMSNNDVGSEQSGYRPYVVIQNNIGNLHCPTVLAMAITSKCKKTYLPTHCIIEKTTKNGLKMDSMVLGETLTQISKERIKYVMGHIDNESVQNDIINIYIANITGKKKYRTSIWNSIIQKFYKLVREGEYEKAS